MPRTDPYRNFRFVIEVEGVEQGGFAQISGIARDTEVEPYREGGVNDFKHQLVTLTTYPNLTLRRGLFATDLWAWHQDVIDGRVTRKTISIVLKDQEGDEAWRWICAGAYPVKWSGSDLDAKGTEVVTEAVEFVHQGLRRQ